jgi:hypothetical protein
VVLYDRYFFDFISDGKRSNLHLPGWIARLGYRFLLKPELNVFLYASPELVRNRKQELDEGTISQLTRDYLHLFASLGESESEATYLSIENVVLEDTLHTIMTHLQNRVA